MIKRLNEWKDNMESIGMRVNMNKTKWRTSEGEAEGKACKERKRGGTSVSRDENCQVDVWHEAKRQTPK